MTCPGRLVPIDDTALWVVERGPEDGLPMFVIHGGPGIDHHEFADYLDPLTERGVRLLLIDIRSHGRSEPADPLTWTLERHAQDMIMLARALGLDRYVVFGHSYGAFVALQNAVDYPGMAAATVVCCGLATAKDLEGVQEALANFEPIELREQVTASWAKEAEVQTQEEVVALLNDQMPFHFRDPLDPRMAEYNERSADMIGSPDVLRRFAVASYGGIEVEDRLGDVTQPVLLLAGRYDRACPAAAAERMAQRIPNNQLHVFKESAHMVFVEEPEEFLQVVGEFLSSVSR
jgi:proline iminopeptidase